MSRPSGSSLGRLAVCPPSGAMLAVGGPGSRDAARGTLTHKYLERIVDGEPAEEALAAIEDPEVRVMCAGIDLRQVPKDGESEIKLAYDVATGKARRLVSPGSRQYDVTATEIPGTVDVLRADLQPRPRVLDWKTARWDHDVVTSTPQLEFYALCCARILGVSEIEWQIGIIGDTGALALTHPVVLDYEDLARIAGWVRKAWDAWIAAVAARDLYEQTHVGAWTPDVTEGAHCKWCPAFSSCGAKRAALGAVFAMHLAQLDPALLGAAWARAKDAEKVIEDLKSLVKAYVEDGPLPTGDGREIRLDGRGALIFRRAP